MPQPIRAIYSEGQLRLLDPVDLTEGQEVHLVLLSERERFRAALGDLVVEAPKSTDDPIDEEALLREIENALKGQTPLSESIIEERREGP
jgi:predicted DNA-binding antitoxin AbrB/MazE fold protein